MKVLLKRDVKGLGAAGEVKEVASGYASNYLVPRNLAVVATVGVLRDNEQRLQTEARKQKIVVSGAQELANRLDGVVLTFTARAGENGKLYGSITAGDIASGLEMETGQDIDKRKVQLDQPIRELGKHKVAIKFMADVVAHISVVVESDGE